MNVNRLQFEHHVFEEESRMAFNNSIFNDVFVICLHKNAIINTHPKMTTHTCLDYISMVNSFVLSFSSSFIVWMSFDRLVRFIAYWCLLYVRIHFVNGSWFIHSSVIIDILMWEKAFFHKSISNNVVFSDFNVCIMNWQSNQGEANQCTMEKNKY